MSALNQPDNFIGRVNYAAAVISAGRHTTRAFDNCFENDDGDAVAAAIMRRAEKNEKLRENLPRYLDLALATENHATYAGRDLKEVSRQLRLRASWYSHLSHGSRSVGELEELAGIEDRSTFWQAFAKLENSLELGVKELKRIIVDKKVAEGNSP